MIPPIPPDAEPLPEHPKERKKASTPIILIRIVLGIALILAGAALFSFIAALIRDFAVAAAPHATFVGGVLG